LREPVVDYRRLNRIQNFSRALIKSETSPNPNAQFNRMQNRVAPSGGDTSEWPNWGITRVANIGKGIP
jgi:hypothetical protein